MPAANSPHRVASDTQYKPTTTNAETAGVIFSCVPALLHRMVCTLIPPVSFLHADPSTDTVAPFRRPAQQSARFHTCTLLTIAFDGHMCRYHQNTMRLLRMQRLKGAGASECGRLGEIGVQSLHLRTVPMSADISAQKVS